MELGLRRWKLAAGAQGVPTLPRQLGGLPQEPGSEAHKPCCLRLPCPLWPRGVEGWNSTCPCPPPTPTPSGPVLAEVSGRLTGLGQPGWFTLPQPASLVRPLGAHCSLKVQTPAGAGRREASSRGWGGEGSGHTSNRMSLRLSGHPILASCCRARGTPGVEHHFQLQRTHDHIQ